MNARSKRNYGIGMLTALMVMLAMWADLTILQVVIVWIIAWIAFNWIAP